MSVNIWQRLPLENNPYGRTAFRVARVPRDQYQRSAIIHLVRQTKNTVRADHAVHQIQGRPVSEAEISAAETVLMNPITRMMEELLEHRPERIPLKRLRRLAQTAAAAMPKEKDVFNTADGSPTVFICWAQYFLDAYIKGIQPDCPPCGFLETSVPPPFGSRSEV